MELRYYKTILRYLLSKKCFKTFTFFSARCWPLRHYPLSSSATTTTSSSSTTTATATLPPERSERRSSGSATVDLTTTTFCRCSWRTGERRRRRENWIFFVKLIFYRCITTFLTMQNLRRMALNPFKWTSIFSFLKILKAFWEWRPNKFQITLNNL